MTVTICYYTSRTEPMIGWFFDSLAYQRADADDLRLVVVDARRDEPGRREKLQEAARGQDFLHVLPKPNAWQGPHRRTREDWWAISNARNTGVCYAPDGWISWVDDRSVLVPTFMTALREAMAGGYAVAGSYEKRWHLQVENGRITDLGQLSGADARRGPEDRSMPAPGSWWCGGASALPVEFALQVNGVDETCDSLGLEDNLFGIMMENNRLPIRYDRRLKVVEDRTPCESVGVMFRRTDKGKSPNDKSHALLYKLRGLKRAIHVGSEFALPDGRRAPLELRELREIALAGGELPAPLGPTHDWYDGQPLEEMS